MKTRNGTLAGLMGADSHTYGSMVSEQLTEMRALRKVYGGKWSINQIIIMDHVLYEYTKGHSCTASDIAHREGMKKQTVSNALISMTQWVTESPDPDDARRIRLSPSKYFMRLAGEEVQLRSGL